MNARLSCGCAVAFGFVVTAVLAAAPADPWTKVPALPTGCYSAQDEYASKNEVAIETLEAEREAQDGVNQQIADQFTEQNNQDPMKMAAAMQEAMMKDPQNAMKYMEMMGATTDPASLQTQSAQYHAREQQLKEEERVLLNRYQAAFDSAWAPARAQLAEFNEKGELAALNQKAQPPQAENHAIQREADRAYQAMCGPWFGATGPMQAYLKKYKDYLVQERIPAFEKSDAQRLAQYKMVGVAADAYRSTAKHKAATDYLQLAERMYRPRREKPMCPAGGTCGYVPAF